jgi:hypothetical protein
MVRAETMYGLMTLYSTRSPEQVMSDQLGGVPTAPCVPYGIPDPRCLRSRGSLIASTNCWSGSSPSWRRSPRTRISHREVRAPRPNNSGRWYDFGFLIGAGATVGASGSQV